MDKLKLAQLLSNEASDDKKLEILKDIDVTYTISEKSSKFEEKLAYLGYNCLHIAVMRSDLELAQKLLNLGANPLQQGVQDGKTPLRKAVDYVTNGEQISVWKLVGVLQEQFLVNTLLSAQVKNNNPLNAKCKTGISHLHIACMFNHTEAVNFFARSGEYLDQIIDSNTDELPGYTPLHCAIRYSSSETATILLTHSVDIYLKNAAGISSICYLTERLLDANSFLKLSTISYTLPYEKEIERLNSIMKVIVLKHRTNDSNLIENTGLSAFHLACTLKDNWIMQSYIKHDFRDINKPVTCKSEVWSGWTALHFAVCCNIQTIKILLKHGADITIKNARGESALDLCFQMYNPEVALSYLPRNIMMSDKSTKLSDVIKATNSRDSCQEFLQKLKDINISVPLESSVWPGYNLLHMAISMNHRTKFAQVFHSKTDYVVKTGYGVNLPSNETPETFSIYRPRFEMILKRGFSIYAKNADGLTPIHVAFKLHRWHVIEELLARVERNVIGPGNLSFLHIACAVGKRDVVEQLLDRGAGVNSPVTSTFEWHEKPRTAAEIGDLRKILIRRNSTPLHIAVTFKMEEVVEVLLKKYPDVQAEDELGYTPIHLSLTSTKKIAQLLFSRISKLKEVKREDGLSHLHAAAFADNEKAVRKLIKNGADVKQTYRGQTPLHLAMSGEKAARVLVDMGADICAENRNNETPLDLAMENVNSSSSKYIFQKLKNKIYTTSTSGLTPLHIACATLDIDWAKTLLKNGANPNAQMTDGQANTPMHLAMKKAVSTRPVTDKLAIIISLLHKHGADVAIPNNWRTPVHMIAYAYLKPFFIQPDWLQNDRTNLLNIINSMLSGQRSFKVNPIDTNGFSHFHLACTTNNLTVVKKYLDNGVDINLSTCPFADKNAGFTPLHVAIVHKSRKIIQLLIQRGANVKVAATNGNTPLHTAIKEGIINLQLFDALLEKGADINARNLKNETPIMCLLLKHKSLSHDLVYFFMNRGSYIDITSKIDGGQGIIGYTMRVSKSSDIELVLETLIKFCDIQKAISKSYLSIHNIVSVGDCPNLTREIYLKAIQRLMNIGSDIDERDKEGKTALDKAFYFGNVSAIKALLLLGANVNFAKHNSFVIDFPCIPSHTSSHTKIVMENHFWKLAMVKLDLNALFREAIVGKEPNENAVKVIQLELEKAKNKRIFHSLTVKHFLSEWGAVIDYPTLSIGERQAVDNFFKRSDQLREEFPEFAGLLMMQYRKARARVKLMQPVKNILVESGIDLPDLCLEGILKYFKNSELNFLVENADGVPPCKRQRIE